MSDTGEATKRSVVEVCSTALSEHFNQYIFQGTRVCPLLLHDLENAWHKDKPFYVHIDAPRSRDKRPPSLLHRQTRRKDEHPHNLMLLIDQLTLVQMQIGKHEGSHAKPNIGKELSRILTTSTCTIRVRLGLVGLVQTHSYTRHRCATSCGRDRRTVLHCQH
jgi:hypothetical protein